jgi:L-ascorbate metabolism protein UlaG (beta-lactamase superfamily)
MANRRTFLRQTLAAGAFVAAPDMKPEPLSDPKYQAARAIPVYAPKPETWRDDDVTIAWIGHATFLINFFGVRILTDPALFDRVGVYAFGATFGPTRLSPPALSFAAMPNPDIVLLSHVHMDHCDMQSLESLTKRRPRGIAAITSKNTSDVVRDCAWKSLQELDWGESARIETERGALEVRALEVRHFGWRLPGDPDRASGAKSGRSFNAYLLERGGKRIVFGGDTAMTDAFKRAFHGDERGVDIAIMPIGAYYPWRNAHCTPEEAWQMAQDMKARFFAPMHCNTFPLGRESTFEPIERLVAAAKGVYPPALALSAIGKTFVLPKDEG